MLHKKTIYLSSLTALLLFTGCAGTTYSITSNPNTANINAKPNFIKDKNQIIQATTPAQIKLDFQNAAYYTLTASKDGYSNVDISISKTQNENNKNNNLLVQNFELKPISCQTTIVGNTSDVNLKINGESKGQTPVEVTLTYGETLENVIELEKAGFKTEIVKKSFKDICTSEEFIGLDPIVSQYEITSYPEGADVFLDGTLIGKTPFKKEITFGNNGEKRVLKFRKYGFNVESQEVNYNDKLHRIIATLTDRPYKELAYFEPDISFKDKEMEFKFTYAKGFKETVDNSPNSMQVKQIIALDNVNQLIADVDSQDGKITYSVIYPTHQINTEAYIENINLIKTVIDTFTQLLENKENSIERLKDFQFAIDENMLLNINSNLFNMMVELYDAIMVDNSIDNYKKPIKDLIFLYEKMLHSFLKLNVNEFYSDLWLTDNIKGFKKSKITNTDERWVYIAPILDKETIYFSSNRHSKDFEIWKVGINGGSGMTKITNSPYSQDLDPSTDSKGELISYTSIPLDSINQQVWSINKKGYLPSQLKTGYQTNYNNGKIAFVRKSQYTGNNQIWLMNEDGSNETVITDERFDCIEPNLSKDGKWIVFTSNQSGNKDIWRMKTDGSDATQLTMNPSADMKPVFDEKGNIVFVSNRGMIWGVWSLTPKG